MRLAIYLVVLSFYLCPDPVWNGVWARDYKKIYVVRLLLGIAFSKLLPHSMDLFVTPGVFRFGFVDYKLSDNFMQLVTTIVSLFSTRLTTL